MHEYHAYLGLLRSNEAVGIWKGMSFIHKLLDIPEQYFVQFFDFLSSLALANGQAFIFQWEWPGVPDTCANHFIYKVYLT